MFLATLLLLFIAVSLTVALYVRLRAEACQSLQNYPDRRRHDRQPLRIAAELQVSPRGRRRRRFSGHTLNLSLQGMLLQAEDCPLTPDSPCAIALLVERAPGETGGMLRIPLKGRVVRADEHGLGIEFTAMSRETYENLVYLLNLEQTGQIALART